MLELKGGLFGGAWKERFFVLEGARLTYFAEKGGTTKGAVTVRAFTAIPDRGSGSATEKKSKLRRNRIDVYAQDGKVLSVAAPASEDKTAWLPSGGPVRANAEARLRHRRRRRRRARGRRWSTS